MNYRSLRTRYTAVATMMAIAVLAATYFADYLLTDTRQRTALNIEQRQQLLERSRHIRNAVWQSREAVSLFLIDPQTIDNQEYIFTVIDEAYQNSDRILSYEWLTHSELRIYIGQLQDELAKLNEETHTLVKIRTDAHQQYPGFVIASEKLFPRQQEIFDFFAQAIHELNVPENVDSYTTYDKLVRARHRWSQIISRVRMYIASRVGSFTKDSLPKQVQDIRLYHADFMAQMDELSKLDDSKIDLATLNSINKIMESARNWELGFEELVKINRSDNWRTDMMQLRQHVEPHMENIWNLLLIFDATVEQAATHDVLQLSNVASTQSRTIWLFSLLGIFLVIAGFISFKFSILNPLERLAAACKKMAVGEGELTMPAVNSSEMQQVVDAFTNMQKQVQNRQDELEYQTLHDDLTSLANRALLLSSLEQAIKSGRRHHRHVALMIMDLDRFKHINDSLGHQAGDELLKQVGKRLREELRDEDTIARLGGDEFAILLNNANDNQSAVVATKVKNVFDKPFRINEQDIYISASVGITIYPQHGQDSHTLIKHADTAMYHAKRQRRFFCFYDDMNDDNSSEYLSLGSEFRIALNNNSLKLHYQPIIDTQSGEVISAEALLRWHHDQHGLLPAKDVVQLAEQNSLIDDLTFWVIEQAVSQCASWHKEGINLAVSINMPTYTLESPDLLPHIKNLLEKHNLSPSFLIVEITENAMMSDLSRTLDVLRNLDDMGVKISIDDFGTGFSSLNYLRQLPVNQLKIDKSFVLNMDKDENDAVIVRSTIDLAHNLGLKVVAEGVETRELWSLLETLECDLTQGYYIGHPMSAEDLAKLIQSWDKHQADINLPISAAM